MQKTLVVILGPTGVGKTELSLQLAEHFKCPIVNADSRQIYRELPIGTAAPTPAERARVKHHFVGTHSITEDYNAGQFERDALAVINEEFLQRDVVIMSGGSMLYIDAVCRGLDELPETKDSTRAELQERYKSNGLEWLQKEVERLDPTYYATVDRQNPQRLLHALEVTIASGKPYSSMRKGQPQSRPFRIVKIGLTRPREELYERINKRVLLMMEDGLKEEAKRVYPQRDRNSLQTVGYKELFKAFDGEWTLDEAINMIQQNSRHYAKRQLTWYRRDPEVHWVDLSQHPHMEELIQLIENYQQ